MDSARRYLVLTAVGPDRPGLVNQISAAIHAAGGSLEDSRMAILGGEFAVILLLSGAESAIERIQSDKPSLEKVTGLNISLRGTARSDQRKSYLPYRIRATGVDRPGIVLAISQILSGRGVNVASLDSRLSYAPLSGTPMFVLEAELEVPSELELAQLRRELTSACEDDNLDFTLEGSPHRR
jgi:glycine cleavage system transcriptional repressor